MKKSLLITSIALILGMTSKANCPTSVEIVGSSIVFTYSGGVPNYSDIKKVRYYTSVAGGTSYTSSTAATVATANTITVPKPPAVTVTTTITEIMLRVPNSNNNNNGYVWGNVCTFNLVLPVDLTYFKAERVDNRIELEWQTASEYINDYFELQASIDGKDFETINFVTGKGTTNSKTTYKRTLIDSEYIFFRLKQVDYDGQFEIHPVVKVSKDLRGNLLKTVRLNALGVESAYGNIIVEIYTDSTVKKVILQN
tara:strand:+ start:84 stop:845 length:762 start_codon:yes stop_codon:yes gene_type:complete